MLTLLAYSGFGVSVLATWKSGNLYRVFIVLLKANSEFYFVSILPTWVSESKVSM